MQSHRSRLTTLWLLLGAAACVEPTIVPDEDAASATDGGGTADAGAQDRATADLGATEAGGADANADAGIDPACDQDDDGYLSLDCGGDDCDDNERGVHPYARERCSFVDENCSGGNNEGLDCTFLAADGDTLFKIDPFAQSVTSTVEVALPSAYGLLDIDRDATGALLGVTREGLYQVATDGSVELMVQVSVPPDTTGMAINSFGTIFVTNNDGESSVASIIDPETGAVELLGNLTPYASSGDCVVLKDDSLYMTSPDPDDPEAGDLLVYVDSRTAATQLVGPTGFDKVFGLSASYGVLFGVTDGGDVIQIDTETGAGELIFTAEGFQFWGAANGD